MIPVDVPAQTNKIDKYLDYRPKRRGNINVNNSSPLYTGSLPNIQTNDHVTNSLLNFLQRFGSPIK